MQTGGDDDILGREKLVFKIEKIIRADSDKGDDEDSWEQFCGHKIILADAI